MSTVVGVLEAVRTAGCAYFFGVTARLFFHLGVFVLKLFVPRTMRRMEILIARRCEQFGAFANLFEFLNGEVLNCFEFLPDGEQAVALAVVHDVVSDGFVDSR